MKTKRFEFDFRWLNSKTSLSFHSFKTDLRLSVISKYLKYPPKQPKIINSRCFYTWMISILQLSFLTSQNDLYLKAIWLLKTIRSILTYYADDLNQRNNIVLKQRSNINRYSQLSSKHKNKWKNVRKGCSEKSRVLQRRLINNGNGWDYIST